MQWNFYVYMLRCSDKSLYVGVTNNIDRRLAEHQNGRNIDCFTYNRRPISLVFCEHYQYVVDAIAREKQIKGWSRTKKEALLLRQFESLVRLSKRRAGWTLPLKIRSSMRRRIERVSRAIMLRDALAYARAPQHDSKFKH